MHVSKFLSVFVFYIIQFDRMVTLLNIKLELGSKRRDKNKFY